MAISKISFAKTPQAKDDTFLVGEDTLIASVMLDVMANDLGGAAKHLYSIADGSSVTDLLIQDTNGWERTPFYISSNELAVAEERRSEWCLFRLWNFSREPKAFELHPPLAAHVSLTATAFQASFH